MKRTNALTVILAILLVCLSGCDYDTHSFSRNYPYVEYRNSSSNFDPLNRIIEIEERYVFDEGHSYDIIETEKGFDIVLHFVESE